MLTSTAERKAAFSSQNPRMDCVAPAAKRKRNLPGTPDPEAEVIAFSPTTLLATNRFVCDVCGKGFQRDQNLQLHRRGHNLPWRLKQRAGKEAPRRKRVYVCPEASCVHHDPLRALGDLTGIKKHFCRKHGEKRWRCDRCSRRYAVQSDWKAHCKICGSKEYRCDCGTLFSRRDSFITHRAFCDALAEEAARVADSGAASSNQSTLTSSDTNSSHHFLGRDAPIASTPNTAIQRFPGSLDPVTMGVPPGLSVLTGQIPPSTSEPPMMMTRDSSSSTVHRDLTELHGISLPTCGDPRKFDQWMAPSSSLSVSASVPSLYSVHHKHRTATEPSPAMSATALLQKAAQIGTLGLSSASSFGDFGSSFSNDDRGGGFRLELGTVAAAATNHGAGLGSSGGNWSALEQTWLFGPGKGGGAGHLGLGGGEGGEIKDFLGVGVHTSGTAPRIVHGWV